MLAGNGSTTVFRCNLEGQCQFCICQSAEVQSVLASLYKGDDQRSACSNLVLSSHKVEGQLFAYFQQILVNSTGEGCGVAGHYNSTSLGSICQGQAVTGSPVLSIEIPVHLSGVGNLIMIQIVHVVLVVAGSAAEASNTNAQMCLIACKEVCSTLRKGNINQSNFLRAEEHLQHPAVSALDQAEGVDCGQRCAGPINSIAIIGMLAGNGCAAVFGREEEGQCLVGINQSAEVQCVRAGLGKSNHQRCVGRDGSLCSHEIEANLRGDIYFGVIDSTQVTLSVAAHNYCACLGSIHDGQTGCGSPVRTVEVQILTLGGDGLVFSFYCRCEGNCTEECQD